MKETWSQPLRIETPDNVVHITTRTVNSALWFVNNKELEERIYAFLAKYVEHYKVKLYAFQLVGNHYHLVARFPLGNMAAFQRDFNARIAESVRIMVKKYRGGHLFSRRYSSQIMEGDNTLEHYFFYTCLQAVSSKLTARISDYPGKNFLSDAAGRIERQYRYFAYGAYKKAKRKNPKVRKADYWREYSLSFERLPHLDHLSRKVYRETIMQMAEKKRIEFLKKNREENGGEEPRYMTKEELRKVEPGSYPARTKKGNRMPIVLCLDLEAKKELLAWYFSIYHAFRDAVEAFKKRDLSIKFPPGTYRPPGMAFT